MAMPVECQASWGRYRRFENNGLFHQVLHQLAFLTLSNLQTESGSAEIMPVAVVQN